MFKNFRALFFENTGIRQTIIKNTFWLAAAEAITGILKIALIVYIIRILGANEYGKFAFAFSFVSIMVILSDLGLIDTTTRELSRSREKEKDFSSILTLDIILSAASLFLMTIGSFFITADPIIRKTIWVLSVFVLISSFFQIFYSFLRSRQKMEYEAGIKIAQLLIIFLFVIFSVSYFKSAVGLGYGYLLANLIALVLLLIFFHFKFQPIELAWNNKIFKLLKISWPLSLGFVTIWIFINITSIFLGYFNLITENGWYGAASKIVLATVIPATLIINSFYPVLSRFYTTSKDGLQKAWDYLMRAMMALAFPILAGGILLAPKIITLLCGPGFEPSVLALQFLIFIAALNFIYYPFAIMLVVSDRQKSNFFLIVLGIAVCAVLNAILIPGFSLFGALLATLIASVLIFVLTVVVSLRTVPVPFLNKEIAMDGAVAAISSIAMYFLISQPLIYNLNIIFILAIGISAYFLILFIFYGNLGKIFFPASAVKNIKI